MRSQQNQTIWYLLMTDKVNKKVLVVNKMPRRSVRTWKMWAASHAKASARHKGHSPGQTMEGRPKKNFSKLKRFKVTATFSDHRGMKLAIWKSRKFTNV